ncbi:hypothetical protein MKW98_031144 [Papaver atlanticum]|uniref:Response regulatory domain-containing protein n=1 Tax=Papaver atlanticum TaxID=357466 RepID=A0AAD4XM23_9MAGN|nr:hypothetical protein MKW98_031144 [Papaver atlanticum]
MLSSAGHVTEYPAALKSLPADEESKISGEFSRVSISADSMISTMKNEEGYPVGLKVLVVDEDLSRHCLCCTIKNRKFDIILMAILVNDMEGFKQIQQLAMEADLPIIYLVSKATSSCIVETLSPKLFKPISLTSVRCLWFPVAEKRNEKLQKLVQEGIIDVWDKFLLSILLYSRWGDDGSLRKLVTEIQKVEEKEDENYMDGKHEDHYTSLIMNRKPVIPRMASDLHAQFAWEVDELGGTEEADADKILEVLDPTPGLTRKHVEIHLKEYRFLHVDFAREHPSSDIPYENEAEFMRCRVDDDDFWV